MMRHKCRLGFSVLIISSCLMQGADADEKKNGELTELESMRNGGTVPSGSVLSSSWLLRRNITIKDGAVEVVDNGGASIGATIEKGGMQIVTRGGNAMDAKILGGKQFVHEEKGINLKNIIRKSSASNVTVSGGGGAIGQQNIYDGAWAWYTKVENNGEQNLYRGERREGGNSMHTVVSGNGRQHVLAGGMSRDTTLKDRSVQVIYPGGFIDTLKIEGTASSWLHVGAEEASGEVRVNGKGKLYLFAGDSTNHISTKKIPIEGRSPETIFLVGEWNNAERPQINIEDLGGAGGTVIFTSIGYDPHHISLHVEKLSGDLHFRFNISDRSDRSDYLTISGDGSGNHKISVSDSGHEITAPLSQTNSLLSEIPLITDQSSGNGASFALENLSGQEIEAVDGGTYVYRLCKRSRSADHSGDATTWYLGVGTGDSECSNSSPRRTNKKQKTTIFSQNLSSGTGANSQHDSRSSRGRSSASGRKNSNKESKQRPPRHLREVQSDSISSTVLSSESQVIDVSHQVGQHDHSDQKQQPVASAEGSSLSDQMILRSHHQDQSSLQSSEEISISNLLTTPSTDAVLSLSVAPGLIFHNELQAIRTGRGILDRDKKNAALWTYAIKSKETISADHLDFKLEQTGIVLGLSGLSEWENGEFYIGGFGSYDQARIAHARGGVSSINTYSVGAYAAYFDHSGWYLDGILKYNHYQNHLKAISTNGLAIAGDYNQWAVGTSFEAGYRMKTTKSSWFQPYGQLTWLKAEKKEIQLSNNMTGDISAFTSLRSEVGLSLGYDFGLGHNTSSMAYITAAWLRENKKDDNQTMINQQHQFSTDLSGNAGKLGVGLSSLASDKLKLYAQAHYVKGRKTKQSFQGILGVRYSF